VFVHRSPREYGDRARAFLELHGIERNETPETRQPIQQRKTDGTAVEAEYVVRHVAGTESLEGMDASAIIGKKAVTYPEDCN
jgi:hypothetical protein